MPVPKPDRIGDRYQIPATAPATDSSYTPLTLNYSIGPVTLSADGVYHFPQPRWVRICHMSKGTVEVEICTDDYGNLNIVPLVQPQERYIIKFDAVAQKAMAHVAAAPTGPTTSETGSQDEFVTLTIIGPNEAGNHSEQTFPAPFPGLVGKATFSAGARLTFKDATHDVIIEISGLGLDHPKRCVVKPTCGTLLRNIDWVERKNPESYTVKVYRPKT